MDEISKSYKDYMTRVKRENIPCYEPSLGQEEIKNLEDVIKSGWLSESKYTRLFEQKLSALSSRKYGLALSNATAAMIIAPRTTCC